MSNCVTPHSHSSHYEHRPPLGPALGLLVACIWLSLSCSSSDGPTPGTAGSAPNHAGAAGNGGGAGAISNGGTPSGGGAAGAGGGFNGSGGSIGGGGAEGGSGQSGAEAGGRAGAGGNDGIGGAAGTGGDSGGVQKSNGCGQAAKLQSGTVMVQSNQKNRSYVLRIPDDYDQDHPYRLILGFHGATGSANQVAPQFFGLWNLAEGSTIFIAANGLAQGGTPGTSNLFWYNEDGEDLEYIDDILTQVEASLCIDKKKIALEGFSMGGAMVWTAACARPGVFSAAVVHSGGGQPRPSSCAPMPFMSSLGAQESSGAGQTSNSDFFAMEMGCRVAPLPKAPDGGHACNDYPGCSPQAPVRWCDYDGGHQPDPRDGGATSSWMPREVWQFISRF